MTAFCFCILVLLKHLFVSLVPTFGVFLILNYCMLQHSPPKSPTSTSACSLPSTVSSSLSISMFSINFSKLAMLALSHLALAFGPFLLYHDIADAPWSIDIAKAQAIQIFSRLFPFGRGLIHAYWAPNIWSLYCFADRVLLYGYKFICIYKPQLLSLASPSSSDHCHCEHISFSSPSTKATFSPSSGLVGEFYFAFFPSISPLLALALVFLTITPSFWAIWKAALASDHVKNYRTFIMSIVYAGMCSFMCGYHVHEKAILVALIPLALLVTLPNWSEEEDSSSQSSGTRIDTNAWKSEVRQGNKINFLFLQMSLAGTVSLIPLFLDYQEIILAGEPWLHVCSCVFYYVILSPWLLFPNLYAPFSFLLCSNNLSLFAVIVVVTFALFYLCVLQSTISHVQYKWVKSCLLTEWYLLNNIYVYWTLFPLLQVTCDHLALLFCIIVV